MEVISLAINGALFNSSGWIVGYPEIARPEDGIQSTEALRAQNFGT
jgi:hypothetical protein